MTHGSIGAGPPAAQPITHQPARIAGRTGAVAATAAAIVALTPSVAFAHGVTGAGGPWYTYIWSGFLHMLAGWDHLLFVAGIVLLAGEVRRSAKLISLFAIGHSTTLIVATMAGWRINATAVDVVIALSLVFVGVVGWIGKPQNWAWFGAAVLGFGLIHGLGLSTRLQALGLPDATGPLLARVISFNVGVELGQLLAVVLMFMIGIALRRYMPAPEVTRGPQRGRSQVPQRGRAGGPRRGRSGGAQRGRQRRPQPGIAWSTTRVANVALAATGVVAALLISIGAISATSGQPAQASAQNTCQIRKRTETYPGGAAGAHPQKDFYEPSETTPLKDFGHVLGDGMVLVHYRPDLTAEQLAQLRTFITSREGSGVLGGPASGQTEAVKAVNMYDAMVCTEFNIESLRTFKTNWFNDPRSRGQ